MTDHSQQIAAMRELADATVITRKAAMREGDISQVVLMNMDHRILTLRAAAGLLKCHDSTGISLDGWAEVRVLVEYALSLIDQPYAFQPNGV